MTALPFVEIAGRRQYSVSRNDKFKHYVSQSLNISLKRFTLWLARARSADEGPRIGAPVHARFTSSVCGPSPWLGASLRALNTVCKSSCESERRVNHRTDTRIRASPARWLNGHLSLFLVSQVEKTIPVGPLNGLPFCGGYQILA